MKIAENSALALASGERFEIEAGGLAGRASAPAIHGVGDASLLEKRTARVTGTRGATPYGIAAAKAAAAAYATSRRVIVARLSIGCEREAALEALERGADVVAVLATGLGAPTYPAKSADIVSRAACVVTAVADDVSATAAGVESAQTLATCLADELCVAECAANSGTFDYAMRALETGKRVLAVPGPVFSRQSRGTNALVRCGAEVLDAETLGALAVPDYDRIVSALASCPMSASELARALDETPVGVIRRLVELEASGAAVRLPDGNWTLSVATLYEQGKGKRA